MRVAFTMIGGRHWTGGYNYLLNLFRVLKRYGTGQVQPVLFIGEDYPESDLAPFTATGYNIINSPVFDRQRQRYSLVSGLIAGKDREAERTFHAHDIDVVFEAANFFGWRFALPTVAWIPDFQHRHLPQMFSKYAYWRRELGLQTQIGFGRTIMLSSENARKNCEQFYPSSRGRTHVVQFAVLLDQAIMDGDPDEVRTRHGLPKNYIYLPNQFWKHKNHRLVIETLGQIKGQRVVIAATGQAMDPRHPGIYDQLRSLVRNKGLEESFRFLGMVPYRDVIALMRAASAVLNPSFLEGWSTTVEEARALGVPLVLSDIPVHREQMDGSAHFFSAVSPHGLAEALLEIATNAIYDRQRREKMANDEMHARLQSYSRCFETVMGCVAR